MVTAAVIADMQTTGIELTRYIRALFNEDINHLPDTYQQDLNALSRASDDLTALISDLDDLSQSTPDETTDAQIQKLRHDLRNALNLIVGFSRIMLKEGFQSPLSLLQYATLQSVNQTGQTLLDQVDGLR